MPFISRESVHQALDLLLFSSKQQHVNPLSYLTLVDHILSDPAFPKVDNPREIAVQHLVANVITSQLSHLRKSVNLTPPSAEETRSMAKSAIERDVQQQFPELCGWSLLYYRYVRVDLNITSQDYHTFSSIDPRTIRRYQEHAIKRLTQVIADEEWEIRQQFHQLRLLATIPGPDRENLVGRDQLIRHVRHILEQAPPPHVQFTGPRGIGKTALVRHTIRDLIASNVLDQIVWITQPRSVRYIQQQLQESLIREQNVSLSEHTRIYQCAIILDDLSVIGDDGARLPELIQQLGSVYLLVTNTFPLRLGENIKHIVVPEISPQTVGELVRRARPQAGDDLTHYTQALWDRVGGNPAAIQSAINNLNNLDLAAPLATDSESLYQQMYIQGYKSLSQAAQRCFLAYMLLPSESFSLPEVCDLWPEYQIPVQEPLVAQLLGRGLITKGNERRFIRPEAAQRFAQWLWQHDNRAFEHTVSLIDALSSSKSPLVSGLIENVLLGTLKVDGDQVLHWVLLACHDGISQGRYARWVMIFEMMGDLPPELAVMYASCLRRLADYDRTESTLHETIQMVGELGEFELQARGLIELGILLRQQGLYEQAISRFEKAKTIASNRNKAELLSHCNLELAQIALETEQFEVAGRLLASSDLPSNIQTRILHIELLLSTGQLDDAQEQAESVVENTFRANQGRLYGLLGRIMTAKGDLDAARGWFDASITLLEQEEDMFALARSQSNLAALNLQQGDFLDEARVLLDQAVTTQRYLKDRAGLVFTIQNQHTLRR